MKLLDEGPAALGAEFLAVSDDVSAGIHAVMALGWRHAVGHADVNAAAGEVFVTERLRDGMRHAASTFPPAREMQMVIMAGGESRSEGRVLPDGRTDIPIFFCQIFLQRGEHDAHAIVECKRVCGSDTGLCREYVKEGINRFQTEKYSTNHAVGFMIGYVLAGTEVEAVDGINAHLARKHRSAEAIIKPGVVSTTWRSSHPRTAPKPAIVLHHAFFAFP